MPLRDGFFSTATQTSCCNRIQRSNRVRLLVVSTHDFPDIVFPAEGPRTASIQKGFDCLGLYHPGLEGERDFRLVVELP